MHLLAWLQPFQVIYDCLALFTELWTTFKAIMFVGWVDNSQKIFLFSKWNSFFSISFQFNHLHSVMDFGGSKLSGKSAFKKLNLSNKKSTSVVKFRSCWSTPTGSKDGNEVSKMVQDDSTVCMSWSRDEESNEETLSAPYQIQREESCRNY